MEVASVRYFDQFEKEQCLAHKKAVRNQKVRKNPEIKVKKCQIIPVMRLTTHHHSVDGIISNSMWQIAEPQTRFTTAILPNCTTLQPKSCLIMVFIPTFCIKMKLQ